MKKLILATGILAAIASHGNIKFAADKDASGGNGENATGEQEAPAEPLPSALEFLAAHPIVETATLELKKIVIDAGTQPRVAIADDTVKEYAEVIKAAAKDEQPNPFDNLPDESLPQVFRDPSGRCVLADGFHRYGAHKQAHAKEMTVAIRNGTERDALLFSLGTNRSHGVQRTNKDKNRAVKIALSDPTWATYPNTEIARFCGVSEFIVRELRSTTKAPAVRTVKRAGKSVKMNTAAIGKGKGGGAKGAKAKAKAAGKKGKAVAAAGKAGASKAAEEAAAELDKNLLKIAKEVGGDDGGAIRKAVHDGSLSLTAKEIREWAGFAPSKIKAVAPLVTGGTRMSPTKAFDFLASELSDKIITELHNRALGSKGGVFEFETDTVKIVVTHKTKK